MTTDLTLDLFASRIGERFHLHAAADRRIGVDLVEANALAMHVNGHGRQPFSLVFRAPGRELVPQSIYRVEHDTMGAHDIFLVPIGPDEGGMRYEAVFT